MGVFIEKKYKRFGIERLLARITCESCTIDTAVRFGKPVTLDTAT